MVESGPREVDMLSWTARAALELIGQSGLGKEIFRIEGKGLPKGQKQAIVSTN